jgi:enoyl-CoA hydratase/carnithine racemase
MDVMSSIIGARKTEQSVLSGRMYSTEEALTIGLVDEFAKDASEAESKVNAYLQNINKAPGKLFDSSNFRQIVVLPYDRCMYCIIAADCRAMMKQEFRKDIVTKFTRGREEELRFLLQIMMQPKMQKKFELYLEALKKKS